jgi:hypothetical protein
LPIGFDRIQGKPLQETYIALDSSASNWTLGNNILGAADVIGEERSTGYLMTIRIMMTITDASMSFFSLPNVNVGLSSILLQ